MEFSELKHLVEKSQIATLDLLLFNKLRRVSIGMNEVEFMCSNLVMAKITKEGVYREGHGVGDESN